MKTIVANPSLGDALAYSFPIAVAMRKSHFIAYTENVQKIFQHMPFFEKGCSEEKIVTGAPGWHKRDYKCNYCIKNQCLHCGKNIKACEKISQLKNKTGEWFNFLNIQNYKNTNTKFRPKKIIETWSLAWRKEMQEIKIEWYTPFYKNHQCSNETILFNLKSASEKRSFSNEIIKEFQNWDTRVLDYSKDVRENLFLIKQAKHIITIDTSTYWLAKFLKCKNIHLIVPGGLKRHLDLGCQAFIKDKSMSYNDINVENTILNLKNKIICHL